MDAIPGNIVDSDAPRESIQTTVAETVGNTGKDGRLTLQLQVARTGLTEKVISEHRPEGAVRASKPCGHLRESR